MSAADTVKRTHLSFLIVDMIQEQQVFINGLPIGVYRDGVFTPVTRIHNDAVIDLGPEVRLVGSRFKSWQGFVEAMGSVLAGISRQQEMVK